MARDLGGGVVLARIVAEVVVGVSSEAGEECTTKHRQ